MIYSNLIRFVRQGVEKTARGKHEGGDAAWEEEKLKSYGKSELRLTEIQENLCKDSKYSTQCHATAEKVETTIEDWWFHKQDVEPGKHAPCMKMSPFVIDACN